MRWRAATPALAVFAAALGVLLGERWLLDVHWDRFHLPAFDGHVYYTMAETPRVFTVAPWGYRILTPWLAVALPTPQPTLAFAILTLGGLAAVAALLFALGRALGAAAWAAMLTALAFTISGGAREILSYQFLADPLALALGCAVLLAALRGARPGLLSGLLLAAVAAKEGNLVLMPGVAVLLAKHRGWRRGVGEALLSVLPALVFLATLRLTWTPQLAAMPAPVLGAQALARLWPSTGWLDDPVWVVACAAALVGCVVGRGPRLAWLLVGAGSLLAPYLNPADFSPQDLVRLRAYAWPAIAGLALRPFAAPGANTCATPAARSTWALWLACLVLALVPQAVVDGYRRVDLSAERDAALVRATLRGTLAAAAELAAGGTVTGDPARPPRIRGRTARPRWYLGSGWSAAARAGTDAAWLRDSAVIVVPAPAPIRLRVRLVFEGSGRLGAWLDGRRLPEAQLRPGEQTAVFDLDPRWLSRGDHRLRLALKRGGPLRLVRYEIEPGAGG